MDGRWNGRNGTQNSDRVPANYGQLPTAASPLPYYRYTADLGGGASVAPEDLHLPWGSINGQGAMPARGRSGRVSKSGAGPRRTSRHSSLSSAAQGRYEQFASAANSNVSGHLSQLTQPAVDGSGNPGSSIHLTNTEAPNNPPDSIAGLDASIQDVFHATPEAFSMGNDHHLTDNHSSPLSESLDDTAALVKVDNPSPTQTAADVVLKSYQFVKIDSTLCKKLAGEAARREPTQRRRDQKLNIERRSNVEALLAHVTGEVAIRPCKNCHKGHGPWTQCVVYDGQMCGSCTNCWFNASGSRCTFHENNNPLPPGYAPTPPAHASVINFQQPSAIPHGSASMTASFPADLSQRYLTDPTRRLVSNVMEDTIALSKGERLVARIEAAAKELGMRIAEFNEYLQTPEGLAEQPRLEQFSQQSQAGDVSIDESSPAGGLG